MLIYDKYLPTIGSLPNKLVNLSSDHFGLPKRFTLKNIDKMSQLLKLINKINSQIKTI